MWSVIRAVLQRPQIIVVLALSFLVADALLAIFSPASAASQQDVRASRPNKCHSPHPAHCLPPTMRR
jgi:hypothetical protein